MVDLDEEWGSKVAKRGFKNEEEVAEKFRNWKEDEDAQDWLKIMGYRLDNIQSVNAENLSRNIKSDIEISISTGSEKSVEGISIKRAKKSANFNQVDKRWVDNYAEKWELPEKVVEGLKMFVGREGYKPSELNQIKDPEDVKDRKNRRLYFDELPKEYQKALRDFFKSNKERIMRDILKGEPPHQTDWILVTQIYDEKHKTQWTLRSIDNAVETLSGDFQITGRGNMKLGTITIQRKGGDNGRETAQMLQFKMKPFELVEKDTKVAVET